MKVCEVFSQKDCEIDHSILVCTSHVLKKAVISFVKKTMFVRKKTSPPKKTIIV